MNSLLLYTAFAVLLGSAVIGGVFFGFSSFVMGALGQRPAAEGIGAMQSINVVVMNRSFLGVFLGTAVLSLVLAGLALMQWTAPAAPWFVATALCYLIGTFAVTMFGNVPLNKRLAKAPAHDPATVELWQHYLKRWTTLNTVRAAAALIAVSVCALAIMQFE